MKLGNRHFDVNNEVLEKECVVKFKGLPGDLMLKGNREGKVTGRVFEGVKENIAKMGGTLLELERYPGSFTVRFFERDVS